MDQPDRWIDYGHPIRIIIIGPPIIVIVSLIMVTGDLIMSIVHTIMVAEPSITAVQP